MILAMAAQTMLPNLGWLEGDWCTAVERGRQQCETWNPARNGVMEGRARLVMDGTARPGEAMRITLEPGTSVFAATPAGQAAVLFRQVERSDNSITFANPGHDYPQRIRYWRRGEQLVAEIALADGTRPRRWVFDRMP